MNQPSRPMINLDNWRPHKLEEHGIQQVSAARNLLDTRGANLARSKHDEAEGLLDHAEDLRRRLQEKRRLARIRLARRYDRTAVEVLHKIEDMLDPRDERGLLNRPSHS